MTARLVHLAAGAALLLAVAACGPQADTPVAQPAATPTEVPAPGEAAEASARAPDCEDLRGTAPVDGELSEDPDVAVAQQERAQWGVASDEATVEQVLATTEPPYSLGFPHTEEEFEEAIGRNHVGPPAEEVRAWAREIAGDRYAGLWRDHAAGGRSTAAFTGDVTELQQAADERFDGALAVVTAEHSFRDLRALQERIGTDMQEAIDSRGDWPGEGDITSTGIAEDLNRVSVGAVGSEDTAEAITERYGPDMICLGLQPVPGPEHAEVAQWAPDDRAALGPSTTTIDVTVHERGCASGEPATGRIAEPEITYGEQEVIVTIRVVPPTGDQTCPGNPPTPYRLKLDEPLGERTLLDGGQNPAGTPHIDQ